MRAMDNFPISELVSMKGPRGAMRLRRRHGTRTRSEEQGAPTKRGWLVGANEDEPLR